MNYSFLSEAETEYLEAVRFYEEQQAKLGLSLINEFEISRFCILYNRIKPK